MASEPLSVPSGETPMSVPDGKRYSERFMDIPDGAGGDAGALVKLPSAPVKGVTELTPAPTAQEYAAGDR
jgi:hypothetical protein